MFQLKPEIAQALLESLSPQESEKFCQLFLGSRSVEDVYQISQQLPLSTRKKWVEGIARINSGDAKIIERMLIHNDLRYQGVLPEEIKIAVSNTIDKDDANAFQAVIKKYPFDVNVVIAHAQITCLHFAVLRNAKKIIMELLFRGANYLQTDTNGHSPYVYAQRGNNLEIIHLFDEAGKVRSAVTESLKAASPNSHSSTPPLSVALSKSVLRKQAIAPPCAAAAVHSSHLMTLANAASKADLSRPPTTPICLVHLASCTRKETPINKCYCLLFDAIQKGEKATVVSLKEKGFNLQVLNEDGDPTLCFAALQGALSIVQYLLKQKLPVDVVDAYGHTAFWTAAARQDIRMMDCLLSKDAHINHPNNLGRTALFNAAEKGHLVSLQFLISRNATVDEADNAGYTPLGIAVQKGGLTDTQLEIIRTLVRAHADPYKTNELIGGTPMSMAQKSNPKIVEILAKVRPKKPPAMAAAASFSQIANVVLAEPLPSLSGSYLDFSPATALPPLPPFENRDLGRGGAIVETTESRKGDIIYLETPIAQGVQNGNLYKVLTMIDLPLNWAKTRVLLGLQTSEKLEWLQSPLLSSAAYSTEQAAREGHADICKRVQENRF
jgi:ankyrin repeat protein